MKVTLRKYRDTDVDVMMNIWNAALIEGDSMPGDKVLNLEEAWILFAEQNSSIVACVEDKIVGLYILHPNNIGHCAHIANASYVVKKEYRSKGIGKTMVKNSLEQAKDDGFRGLQYNAVVCTNNLAITIYENLGFTRLGIVPGGYCTKEDVYEDTIIFFKAL